MLSEFGSTAYRVVDQDGNLWRNTRGVGLYESRSGAKVARAYAQKSADRSGWDFQYRVQKAALIRWENVD